MRTRGRLVQSQEQRFRQKRQHHIAQMENFKKVSSRMIQGEVTSSFDNTLGPGGQQPQTA